LAAILGAIVVAQKIDFLKRIQAGEHPQNVVLVVIDKVGSVEVITVRSSSLAVYGNAHGVVSASNCQRSAGDGSRTSIHTRLKRDELHEVSLVHGKLRDLFLLDQRALRRILQLWSVNG